MVRIRGSQLVRNECNASNSHSPIATMENRGRPDEIYRHVDCFLFGNESGICVSCSNLLKTMQQIRRRHLAGTKTVKVIHSSDVILAETVQLQRKVCIYMLYPSRKFTRFKISIKR